MSLVITNQGAFMLTPPLACHRLIVSVCAGLILLFAVAPPTTSQQPKAGAPKSFLPEDLKERQGFCIKLVSDRKATIYQLLDFFDDFHRRVKESDRGDVVQALEMPRLYDAVRVLGEFRAPEAATPILALIDFDFDPLGRRRHQDSVQIEALIKIGKPASVAALRKLADDADAKGHHPVYVRVIAQVEGIDLGKEMVRLAMDKEKDPAKKARLKGALDLFKDADKPIP